LPRNAAGSGGAEKKLAEAEIIIANEQLRKAKAARVAEPPVVEAETPAAEVETPAAVVENPAAEVVKTTAADPQTKDALTTTQWLSVISIIISVVGIYYQREEIKKVFAQKGPTPPPVDFRPPPVKTSRKGGLQPMD